MRNGHTDTEARGTSIPVERLANGHTDTEARGTSIPMERLANGQTLRQEVPVYPIVSKHGA